MENQGQQRERQITPRSSIAFLEAVKQCLRLLCAAFHQALTEEMAVAYGIGLADLTSEQLLRATRYLLLNHKEFMPTPAQIRAAVEDSAPPRTLPRLSEPPLTKQEAREILSKMKSEIPCLSSESLKRDGVIVITDEMRAEAVRKSQEALRRFRGMYEDKPRGYQTVSSEDSPHGMSSLRGKK
jgi:hypothetical protein